MSNDKKDRDYKVGYGKPPKSTQFKKGQSGNPDGRPKGAKGVTACLKRELEATITIQEGGRKLRISKAEAMAKQFMNKALNGDIRAIMALLKLDPELYGSALAQLGAEASNAPELPAPVDLNILRDHFLQTADNDVADDDGEAEDPNSVTEEADDDQD